MAERDAIETLTGYGMGDAYRGVWDCLIEATKLRQDVNRKLKRTDLKQGGRPVLEKRAEELRLELARLMLAILPYERARPTSAPAT